MKKHVLAGALLAVACLLIAVPASAHRFDRSSYHPMRVVAYVLHPVGIAAEYVIARPIHYVVSQPDLDIIFGHQAYLNDEGTYFEWLHGDYEPSIKVEKREREQANRGMVR
jgi:hypothetical protein